MANPKNSKQLKQLILAKEEEVRRDREILKGYFRPEKTEQKPLGILAGLQKTLMLPSSLKTELIKTALEFIAGFVAKKWLTPKLVEKEAELSDQLFEKEIKKAIDNNSDKMDQAEREILKKLLHQYIHSK